MRGIETTPTELMNLEPLIIVSKDMRVIISLKIKLDLFITNQHQRFG